MTIIISSNLQMYEAYELLNWILHPLLCARGQAKRRCTTPRCSEPCSAAHRHDKAIRHLHLWLMPSAAAERDDYLCFPFQEMELQGSHAWDALTRIFSANRNMKKETTNPQSGMCNSAVRHFATISHSTINYSFWHKQLAQCQLQ